MDAKINPYIILGVGDDRAKDINDELDALRYESNDVEVWLTALAKQYDPESLVMGMYLGSILIRFAGCRAEE
jgi:hypothetical protein